MGVAADCKMKNQKNKIVVILGDGELNEGSVWEGLLVASALKLNNLIVIVDRNEFQANIKTEELIPLEPLKNKFETFGWQTYNCDGHNFSEIEKAFESLPSPSEKPIAVIASTKRGKGLPSIEERADRWFCNFKEEEIEMLLKELHTQEKSGLTSETLIVR
jgi:transketolase